MNLELEDYYNGVKKGFVDGQIFAYLRIIKDLQTRKGDTDLLLTIENGTQIDKGFNIAARSESDFLLNLIYKYKKDSKND